MAPSPRAIVVPGNHDGVHRGHRALVERARSLASARDIDVVALTFDPHPAAFFGREVPATLTPIARRVELLREAGADRVIVQRFDADFAARSAASFVDDVLVGTLGAAGIVVGPSFRYGRGREGDVDSLKAAGASARFLVHVEPPVELDGVAVSSTAVRQLLAQGDVARAAAFLGRSHDVDASVVHGQALARTLGFPTANLAEESAQLPADGVYAVWVTLLGADQRSHPGVCNIGMRPTVSAGRAFEVHLLDGAHELYGQRMRVAFVDRIRPERRFANVDALRQQIADDAAAAGARLRQGPRVGRLG